LWQKLAQAGVDARLMARDAREFRVRTLVGFGHFAGALEDERFRRLEARQIGRTAGILRRLTVSIVRA
jgi:hypothetical protein